MTENVKQGTVLVTAATGKTGRRVAERLAQRGVRVRAGSRTGEVPFDWEDDTTWAPALRGADAAYVAYYPDLAAPTAADALRTFGRLSVENGVRRLVLLSGRGEPQAVTAEEAVRESGVELTVVRASFFAQNFSEGFLADGLVGGELPFPAGEVAEPFIDADDLADVVVAVLTEDGHAGAVHEVTGPRALAFREAVAEIASATGLTTTYVPVSGPEYRDLLEQFGLPADFAAFASELFTFLLDGHNTPTTDGVKRVLGREPRDFADYVRTAVAAGAWGSRE
ncbi:NAD(P)H-binding protein [Streptomyces sp. NPDC051219]|uniref:NAD(P)H-binding protein n=1 Tax=Streptomyces sp. NPDC051219 TaxID=3155283 RepID=UPI003444AC39